VFSRILDLIEQFPALERRVESVMRAVNREYIRFTSGQTIRFKARSTGSGRGFSCDCLLLDEAQILGAAAWSAILPTMSARPNPQAWLLGTPPTENDDGEVFERLRSIGLEGKEPRVAYLEWSADPDAAIDDPETWASANPAYGTRIGHEAIATELASMGEEQFRMERLGIWPSLARHIPVLKASAWRNLLRDGPAADTAPAALAVDMSHAMQISVTGSWVLGEVIHVEEVWAGDDVAAAVEWISAAAKRRIPVLIDGFSPAAQMIPELSARGVKAKRTTAGDMTKGCLIFETRANAGTLSHSGQPQLAAAVAGARKRPIGDAGGWGWDRRDATVTIHPLVAATLALLSASSTRAPTSGQRISTRRGAVLL
jgi:phage terminase large subunit-like protein